MRNVPDDTPLLRLGPHDLLTIGDACKGVHALGMTGSGKTSGIGRALALAMLRLLMGMCVLCAKPGEAQLWRRYARAVGREHEILILGEGSPHRFNFLNYELCQGGGLQGVNNAVALCLHILEVGRVGSGTSATSERFWTDAITELLTYGLTALYAAYGRVAIADIVEMATSAPQGEKQLHDDAFCQRSFCVQTLMKASKQPVHALPATDQRVMQNYFTQTFCHLDNKTRSNILVTLTSTLRPFLTGRLRELFCTTTTIVPEMSHEGLIIVLDMPLKTWHQDGLIAQQIFKYCWQRATERRTVTPATLPVGLFADESHLFISRKDAEFLSTARSSRAATVYLTQSLQAYYEALQSPQAEHTVQAMLGNFETTVFHLLKDPSTARYASDLVGTSTQWRVTEGENSTYGTSDQHNDNRSTGFSLSGAGESNSYSNQRSSGSSTGTSTNHGHSSSAQETIDVELRPDFFMRHLRNGGPQNNLIVDGIVVRPGRPFRYTGRNWLPCQFSQT